MFVGFFGTAKSALKSSKLSANSEADPGDVRQRDLRLTCVDQEFPKLVLLQRSTQIQHWIWEEERVRTGPDSQPVLDSQKRLIKDLVRLDRPKVITAAVFNGSMRSRLMGSQSSDRTGRKNTLLGTKICIRMKKQNSC
jgi:hypothetical protein